MPNPERLDPTESDISKTVTLTEKDLRDVARLFKLLVDPAMLGNGFSGHITAKGHPETNCDDREERVSTARKLLSHRRIRNQYFRRDNFGEPAWEILLALYVTETGGARLTMSKLAEWIEAPLTTVVRWVKALEDQSLVGRVEHPNDRRIIFIRLLETGRKALDGYLAAIAE